MGKRQVVAAISQSRRMLYVAQCTVLDGQYRVRDLEIAATKRELLWQWHGYRNSWVTIDGLKMQSVSGGGHWGGGVWISTRDHALFGYLFLRRGRWQERQIISERWIDLATTPCLVNPAYGYMWWLNTNQQLFPSAPQTSFYALGAGRNLIWVDPDHDLVVVVRWIDPDSCDEFMKRVLAALN